MIGMFGLEQLHRHAGLRISTVVAAMTIGFFGATPACTRVVTGATSEAPPVLSMPLRAPFDVATVRRENAKYVRWFETCPTPPAVMRDIQKPVFYTDAAQSVRDPALWAQANQALQPMKTFGRTVARMSDDYVVDNRSDARRARCVADWLLSWSRGRALLGRVSTWGSSDRIWFVAINASTALLKIDAAGVLTAAERREIATWLADVVRASIAQNDINYSRFRGTPRYGNNQVAWAAAGALVTGVAAQDEALFQRGLQDLATILDLIGPDGLNADALRGERAVSYLFFGLGPLTVAMAYARANGADMVHRNDAAFERLWTASLRLLRDPAPLEQALNVRQTLGHGNRRSTGKGIPLVPLAAELTCAEPIQRQAALENQVPLNRRGYNDQLGGNVQWLYAGPPPVGSPGAGAARQSCAS